VPKTLNPRLAKIHRNYTMEEAARLYGLHRNTVRQWTKRGQPTIPGHPVLILGRELRAFLQTRREQGKRHCGAGEMYCLPCREPRTPIEGMVEYQSVSRNRGRFVALCSRCESVMYRSANPTRLPSILASMIVTHRRDGDT
jgi:hypothetical protein